MAIEFKIKGKTFTTKDILTVIALLAFLITAVGWFLDTKASNKAVPLMQTTINEMKIDITNKAEDIREHEYALEDLYCVVEEIDDKQDVMGMNVILLMRDRGIEPIE